MKDNRLTVASKLCLEFRNQILREQLDIAILYLKDLKAPCNIEIHTVESLDRVVRDIANTALETIESLG